MCEYEYENGEKCHREALEGSEKGCCILHEDWENKDEEETRDQFYKEIEEGEMNFEGCVLPGFSLSERGIEQDLCFRKAIVKGLCLCDNTQFLKNVNFREAEFSKGASFEEAKFNRNANFEEAKFSEFAYFLAAKFSGNALFMAADFSGYANFMAAKFSKPANFQAAGFSGDANFLEAKFSKLANFQAAEFSKLACFSATEFGENAYFIATEFRRDAYFDKAKFREDVKFTGTRFIGSLTLFKDDTVFKKNVDFSKAGFYGSEVLLHTDLSRVSFQDTSLKNVDLSYAEWLQYRNSWPRSVCRDDYEAESHKEYSKASDVCREIKQTYQRIGNYRKAREFYYGEMECYRRSLSYKTDWIEKSLYQIYRAISGYGESAIRVILFALSTIIAFSGFFFWQGFQLTSPSTPSHALPILKQMGASLYLSVVTFTTLGLGDIHPLGLGSHILVGIESFIGAFAMALFVLVFARKFMR